MIGTAEAGGGAAPLRVGSPAERNARARCSGPPCTTRWTTLRVQGPTLRDAALANGGHGSPPVAPRLLPQPRPRLVFPSGVNLTAAGEGGGPAEWACHFAGGQRAPSSEAGQSATRSQAVDSRGAAGNRRQ